MINALKGLGHNQFEWARWAPESYDKYKFIQVSRVGDNDRRWNPMLQNISASADSILLKTAYIYDYKPLQHLFFRNKWYVIINAREITEEVNSQALALVRNGNPQYVLEIREANGYDVDRVYSPVSGV